MASFGRALRLGVRCIHRCFPCIGPAAVTGALLGIGTNGGPPLEYPYGVIGVSLLLGLYGSNIEPLSVLGVIVDKGG